MKPTKEQEEILHSAKNMEKGQILIVNALAGCAKTTTLQKIAEDNPDSKFLYLAFNRAIVEDAKNRFPENTKATTLHGLARGYEGRKEIKTLSLDLVSKIISKDIKSKDDYFQVFNSLKVYEKFTNSHYSLLELDQLEENIKQEMMDDLSKNPRIKNEQKYWVIKQRTKMIPKVPEIHRYILESDFTIFGTFLKEFVDSADSRAFNYDYIVLDESQDISKLLAKFIISISKSKKYKIIVVGDNNQKIYGFLGNINLSDVLEHIYEERVIKKNLTKSFRFKKSSEMEVLSNSILNLRKEKIIGSRATESSNRKEAFISRNTFPLLTMAIYQIKAKKDYFLLGEIDNFNKKEIRDIYSLYLHTKRIQKYISNFFNLKVEKQINELLKNKDLEPFPKIETKSLQPFSSFLELHNFAERRAINELLNNIYIALFIDTHSNNMSQINNIEHSVVNLVDQFFDIINKHSNPSSNAIISTIHKTKGLEFDRVTILKPQSIILNKATDKWELYAPTIGQIIGLQKDKNDFSMHRENSSNAELSEIFNSVGANNKTVFSDRDVQKTKKHETNIQEIKSNKIFYELKIDKLNSNIREEYNILYVAITRAMNNIQISNIHYVETLEFLQFLNENLNEILKIFKGMDSPILKEINIRGKYVFVIIYEDSFIRLDTLRTFLKML
jgi:superfamily I DNA/RNA helicase